MKKIPTHDEIIKDIESYLKKKGVKAHDFGKKYLKDSGAVSRLRNGADPRLSSVIRIYNALKDKS